MRAAAFRCSDFCSRRDRANATRLRWGTTLLAVLLSASLVGCASYRNQLLTQEPPPNLYPANYTFDAWVATRGGIPDPAIVLSFSGGFLHAAALANGTLQALRRYRVWACPQSPPADKRSVTANPPCRWEPLLDHIVIVSSTSGGSYANANFLVHGEAGLDTFETNFLQKNLAVSLLGQVAERPWTWLQILGPAANRSQFMIDNLNATILARGQKGVRYRFADLSAQRPFAMFGTTDYSAERHFVFTQDAFRDLCSDLSTYPLADAVTASGAFPGLLTDVELKNYYGFRAQCPLPAGPAFDPRQVAPHQLAFFDKQLFLDLRYSDSLRRAWVALDSTNPSDNPPFHPEQYLHLFDGGIGDNLAVRPLLRVLDDAHLKGAFAGHTILYVQVNARSDLPSGYDATASSPLLGSLALGVPYDAIDNDTALSNYVAYSAWSDLFFDAGKSPPSFAQQMFVAEIDFDQDSDLQEQKRLKELGGISLRAEDVKFVDRSADHLLLQHPCFADFLLHSGFQFEHDGEALKPSGNPGICGVLRPGKRPHRTTPPRVPTFRVQ